MKIIINIILAIAFLSSISTYAKIPDVRWMINIIPETDSFILFWDQAIDDKWNKVESYQVLISTYPVSNFEYYQEYVNAQYNIEWFKVKKFWSSKFEEDKDYYFSVVASVNWEKSKNYSQEVKSKLIKILEEDNSIKHWSSSLNELTTIKKKPEIIKTNTWAVTGSTVNITNTGQISNTTQVNNTPAITNQSDDTFPEEITNLKAKYNKLSWVNSYEINLNWNISKNLKWDVSYQNLYTKTPGTMFWKPEKIAKNIASLSKKVSKSWEYSYKITSVDTNKNETAWVLINISIPSNTSVKNTVKKFIPKILPQTWISFGILLMYSLIFYYLVSRSNEVVTVVPMRRSRKDKLR